MPYSYDTLKSLHELPFAKLIEKAHHTHTKYHDESSITLCAALSIKTGGCPENCGFCSQSAHHKTFVTPTPIADATEVAKKARTAKQLGATHFCLGGAWGPVPKGKSFKQVLTLVKAVYNEGLQVCCSLGMIDVEQALSLKKAGCSLYNHNLDTSPKYYPKVITTRTYQDRLNTISAVQKAELPLSCGGILGLGESSKDRIHLVEIIQNLTPKPQMIPINILVPVSGTPLGSTPFLSPLEVIKTIALTRIALPKATIALGGGRSQMDEHYQALCFFAGVNAIYFGETILTTPVPSISKTHQLLKNLNLKPAHANTSYQ